ncbi:unnamed protein product [Toxocara canis]|uniref:Chromo domain-containing protein n=1 Tax=Toxocara canis TaxID=6265 RepID=A0A183U1I9_TOXCA|nr:unnamed protein product [Toxocara canis]
MLGLTVVRAMEVHELMAADYPAIYSEYQRAAADKVKLQMVEQQKQLDAMIQPPKNRWRRCISEVTWPGPYPVALVSGQFHEHYERYTSAELRRLPLSAILDYEYLLPPKRGISPPLVVVHNEELLSPLLNEGDQDALPSLQSTEDGQSGAEENCKKQVNVMLT